MKRGDYAALLLFSLLAGLAFWSARDLGTVIPPLGDSYFNVPLSPLPEALSSLRTLGYPLFHAFVANMGQGLPAYPEAQMLVLIPCVFVFGIGLRAYGLPPLAALIAVVPLLWIVPVEQVIPETLAKCFAVATLGFLLWAAGTRNPVACVGLALAVFAAYQVRPAFLFLVAWAPVAWLFLYSRRWGFQNQIQGLRQGLRIVLACTLPLFLFCLLRLAVVDHFGLVSFGGQNTIGIAIEMLDSESVARLPAEDRPLAQILARGRDAWPAPRFLTRRGTQDNWIQIAELYAANVNRTGRALQAKFPPAKGQTADNVALDKAFSRVSLHTFQSEWLLYRTWLVGAAAESFRMALVLLLGGGGSEGFGMGAGISLSLALILITLLLLAWPLERRAFGEGSRPHFTRATTVLLFLSGTFFLSKMLLVILVEPPITRYVEAAAFLLPGVAALLCWDRAVVLAAALLRRPHWYNQCYAAYPAIPDTARTLPWRAWAGALAAQRRAGMVIALVLILLGFVAIWSTRDTRRFHELATHPERLRPELMAEDPPVTWRAESGATVLHHAALLGDAELLAHLLEKGAQPDVTTNDGATALHWAAMSPQGDAVVPLLLATGLSTDTPGPQGLSPTHLAALFSNPATLQTLLIGGAHPGVTNAIGVTPLHLAGSKEVAETLLKGGAPLDAADGTGATPFMWAHTSALARFLLEQGANINARENWRSFVRECTPLAKAAYQSDNDRARWLLEQGADPNAGDINNLSPIYYAIWRRNNPLLQMLLDRGADPNHPGRWTTYDREYTSSQFTDLFAKTVGRHLMRESFPRLVPDKALMHPLDWAAFIGNTEAMDILIARGAQLEAHNAEGMSSLHWAMLGRQKKAEKLLRDRDPKLDRLDDSRLPAGKFRASVEAGRREMSPAPAPQPEVDKPPLPDASITTTTLPPAPPLP